MREQWPELVKEELTAPKLLLPSAQDSRALFRDAIVSENVALARSILDILKVRGKGEGCGRYLLSCVPALTSQTDASNRGREEMRNM